MAWVHHAAAFKPPPPLEVPPQFNISSLQAAEFMPRVLVFCESGNEKSAAVVAAYMMASFQEVDASTAMLAIQARRFCCSFGSYDTSFKNILVNYGDILQAQRDVDAQMALAGGDGNLPRASVKRGREPEDDEEDINMDRIQAPFR
jgi:serine/threonine/tyrosine-interacting protein